MVPTLNPAIRLSARSIITALMINKKRHRVRMVTGNVKITRMGLTKKFSRLSTIATIIAVR